MRIVIIADFADASGGAQTVAIQSAASLAARGVPVTFIHGVEGPADPRLAAPGIDQVSLGLADIWARPALRAALTGIHDRDAARRLAAALDVLPPGPRLLHLHQWTRSLSPAVFPVLLRQQAPLAVTLHDYFIACPNGVYYRFEREAPCTVAPLSPSCLRAPCDPRSSLHKAIRVARSLLTRRAIRGQAFDAVHVSDRGQSVLAPLLPPGLRHHRIDNPVEIAPGPPAAIAPDGRIAFIGRLTREKGADLVAAAARMAGLPSLFVGEGPAEAEIRRLDPDAEILGWRSREEVSRLLRTRVRAVAAPSRWFETGPLTVYEALASGVPAVASARSGAAEKVADGETGFVVEPSLDALAGAFRRLAEPRVAARLGAEAHRRYWAAPMDAAAHAERLLALYRTMAAR